MNGDPFRHGLIKVSDDNAGEGSDAFTLESGFFVPEAVAEMFGHRSNDDIWLGYGIPDEWNECSCSGIAVEGAHRLKVCYSDYHLNRAEIQAGSSDRLVVHVRDEKREYSVFLNGTEIEGREVRVKRGDVVLITEKED